LTGILVGKNLWAFEQHAAACGFNWVAGVDEVGRGPLAGPVLAAAVILPADFSVDRINDSKKLSPTLRDYLYDAIYRQAVSIGIGIVDAGHIDRINILQASLRAMAMAVANLRPGPDYLLIDGPHRVPTTHPAAQQPIVRGDNLSISIAAASIVAKVSRDRLMDLYQLDYPQFGFSQHKGYPTKAHRDAIGRHGCCPIHRRSFRGVAGTSAPAFGCTIF
jgi:ribonuclease HII